MVETVTRPCTECKGTGIEQTSLWMGIITFGIWYLVNKIMPLVCSRCLGRGYVVYHVRDDEYEGG